MRCQICDGIFEKPDIEEVCIGIYVCRPCGGVSFPTFTVEIFTVEADAMSRKRAQFFKWIFDNPQGHFPLTVAEKRYMEVYSGNQDNNS